MYYYNSNYYNFFFFIIKNPSNLTILGIKHFDYKSHPVNVEFGYGGIGYNYAEIKVTSQRGHGINSLFIFYGY